MLIWPSGKLPSGKLPLRTASQIPGVLYEIVPLDLINIKGDTMDLITILIGIVPIAYGIYVFILRVKGKTDNLKKLEPMKNFWGPRLGSSIHAISYIVAPMLLGCVLIFAGFNGISIGQFFSN